MKVYPFCEVDKSSNISVVLATWLSPRMTVWGSFGQILAGELPLKRLLS